MLADHRYRWDARVSESSGSGTPAAPSTSINWDDPLGVETRNHEEELQQEAALSGEKRLYGGTSDQNHLAPFAYPWAFEMYKKARANLWNPTEISMGKDNEQYWRKLTDAERHMFHTTFSYLSTSDIMVLRNTALCVMSHITAPEVNIFLAEQTGQEAMHMWAYQTCVDVLGLDPNEVYTLYKRIPQISQKIELAKVYGEKIENAKNVNDFLKGLIFYYCGYEGGFFYTNFNPIFSLRRRALVPGSSEQLMYIQRDEHMHVAFGVKLITAIMAENDHSITEHTVIDIFNKVVESEEIFAEYAIPNEILGYRRDDHVQHLKHLLDRRLKQLGFATHYNVPDPFPWLAEVAHIRKETNFFEGKVTEYQKGGLSWEN